MTELRLVTAAPEVDGGPEPDGPFSAGTPLPRRLPPGRHGIPANLVTEHQRLRLLAAMAEALGTHGYANITTTHVSECANVSTSTFYKHFGNLWDCLLAAYVAAADRLCAEVEAACAAAHDAGAIDVGSEGDPLATGIEAALEFFAAEPELCRLLSAQAPREATALCAARRILVSRLAALLRRARRDDDDSRRPPGLDERLIDATLAFLHTRLAAEDPERLTELCPELVAILDRPRVAAA
jgi:AcrR family transcriptional regulator